jgi:hypothetical protein
MTRRHRALLKEAGCSEAVIARLEQERIIA